MSNLPKRIDSIHFGLLSPDEIRRMSVQRIIVADTYDEEGTPVPGGLMDGALGTIDPGQRCRTCGNRIGDCPGHFGSIELARPVIHVGFNKVIYKLLNAICRVCGRVVLDETRIKAIFDAVPKTDLDFSRIGIVPFHIADEVLKEAAKVKQCPHCIDPDDSSHGTTKYKIRLEKPTTFYEELELEDGTKQINKITSFDIRELLRKITPSDCQLLGIDSTSTRPEWMILTALPVPPVCVRPSITLDSGIRSEDDLTHKLVDIIRINQRLLENRDAGAPQLIVEDLWELLQYHVTTFLDNEVSGIPPARHRSGRALRTITQRLKGKEGRFRLNLSGKRVDFSARTVISPDPLLSINEVGVPRAIAEILTVPERVTEWNIEEMKELVMKGPQGHPGANYIIRNDGRRVDLRFTKDPNILADALAPGFIIERHLRDGDVVLFNRQPSLHRISIMAHEVRVMPYRTFRLNLCVCRPYNADFDGDEMNLHVPQSEEARSEAYILMRVQEHISTPRYGGPIIGAIQDFITSSYFLTMDGSVYTREEASTLVTAAHLTDLPEPRGIDESGKPYWTGKQLFSTLLPTTMNFTMKSMFCVHHDECKRTACELGGYVAIRNGQLISGVIDKKGFGAEQPDSVLHRILKEYGSDATRQFLDGFTKMLIANIDLRGFSMGFDDVDIPLEGRRRIDQQIADTKDHVNQLIQTYEKGLLERQPGRTLEETLEMLIMAALAKVRDNSSNISAEYLGMANSAVIMAKSGARGNMLNLGQMSACVGQQSVRGKRITRGYKERTLPHFKHGDLSADGRGFVDASFRSGLEPIEFFMHACGGREGLVDTAVRTSTSGYMQRRLINALQDISSLYDGTVRDSIGGIIQFIYGDDNVDPTKSDHGKAVNLDIILDKVLETELEGD